MLPLAANHPARSLTALASQIALPHEHAPMRFPSFPALERTATMAFNTPATLSVPAGTSIKGMLTRQASYPAWAQQPLASAWIVDYELYRPASTATTYEFDVDAAGTYKSSAITSRTATATVPGFPDPTTVGGVLPPWGYPILGEDDGTGSGPWIYVPEAWYLHFSCGMDVTPGAGAVFTLTYDIWIAPGQSYTWAPPAGSATTTGVVAGSDLCACSPGLIVSTGYGNWIRPRSIHGTTIAGSRPAGKLFYSIIVASSAVSMSTSTTTQGNFNSSLTSAPLGMLPLNALTEFPNSYLPWNSTRLTACSLLCTNVTSVLNKGGTILAGRVDPKGGNAWATTQAIIAAKHPSEKAYLALETGLYTYCPPSTDLATFYDYTSPTSSYLSSALIPVYRLDNDALVNVFFLTSPAATASVFAVNVDWHIEFRTASTLFDVGISTISLETLHQAQLSLIQVGFFFENFDHKVILRGILSAAKWAAPHLAGALNPELGRVVGDMIRPSAGSMQPPSTSIATTAQAPRPKTPSPKPPPSAGLSDKEKADIRRREVEKIKADVKKEMSSKQAKHDKPPKGGKH